MNAFTCYEFDRPIRTVICLDGRVLTVGEIVDLLNQWVKFPGNSIPGTPEGRKGIWLITPETAAALIDAVPGEEIHNFLGDGNPFCIGATWSKEQARELVRRPDMRLALIFEPNVVVGHHLVALNDEKRFAFDVGEIKEERMVPCTN